MSKIKYEIFDCTGELSKHEKSSGDIMFCFSGVSEAHFSICGHKYSVTDGSVKIPAEKIENGVHIPRLFFGGKQIVLPLFKKEDNEISFPEAEGISHALSLRLARQNAKIKELQKAVSELESYVKGSTCF